MSTQNKDKPSLFSSGNIKEAFALGEPSKCIKKSKYRKATKERAMSNADMGASEVLPGQTVELGTQVGDRIINKEEKLKD